eukprot:CAMPEP_0171200022 /NCGR_PEP_ID=MMETSP0790-20130122/23767_1 /TAXON_ID=2925 /ORGANISM="Alexandrium catenella, Strain OF101" /LENGTH=118 /DNA_ID=CAMNT_0011665391 /DNA_START=91 /DNA_END=444 /DNA_ORIENTATION=+
MPTGVVKKWMDDKGFGFVTPDDGGEDLFLHASCIADGSKGFGKGDKVRFKSEYDDRKGKMRAIDASLEAAAAAAAAEAATAEEAAGTTVAGTTATTATAATAGTTATTATAATAAGAG